MLIFSASGNEPPDSEGSTNYGGPWNVTTYKYRGNQTIFLDGNLTIEAGGKLVLRNVTMIMQSTPAMIYSIRVLGGGEFHILDKSVTTTNITVSPNGILRYYFWADESSKLVVKNSRIENCGNSTSGGDRDKFRKTGVYVETADALFDNVIFLNNSIGLVLDNNSFDNTLNLKNLYFTDCPYGLYSNSSSGIIKNLKFHNNSIGIVIGSISANNIVDSMTFDNFSYAGILNQGINTKIIRSTFQNSEYGVIFNGSSGKIDTCDFYDLKYGLYIVNSISRIINSNFRNLTYGAYIVGGNSIFDEVQVYNISNDAFHIKGGSVSIYESSVDYTTNGIVFNGTGNASDSIEVNFTRVWHNVGYGLFLNAANAVIKTVSIHNSSAGLVAPMENSRLLVNNSLFDMNRNKGISTSSRNATITNTSIRLSSVGIEFFSNGSYSGDNTINNCTYGINLTANHQTVENTVIKGANYPFPQFDGTMNNTIAGSTIVNNWNSTLDLKGTDGFKIMNNKFIDNTFGLFLNGTSNTTLVDNELRSNGQGIMLHWTNGANVSGNYISFSGSGIQLNNTNGTLVGGNQIWNNPGALNVNNSDHILIFDNVFDTNENGTYINGSDYIELKNNSFRNSGSGVILKATINTGIYENNFRSNPFGLRLSGKNTTIIGNNFNNPGYGLNLTGNNGSTTYVYHNNFYKGIIAPENATDWSYGYPDGGNYYDYSNPVDQNCTIWQNITGPDGLADAPYVINASFNVIDAYPLATPWPVNHLPGAENFTFELNISVKPKAVMFIANGSDPEDLESSLFPMFEYRPPNGTWENTSISLYRYVNGTWYANLTHPLNSTKGWYDIRVRFRDTGGYFSDMITIYQAFNISTEKPLALSLNSSSYQVNRTHTVNMQLNGTDPDESEFNLTPHAEIRSVTNTTWLSVNFWDPHYEFVNFTGNDTGNYTKGYWSLNLTPDINLPAGQYFVRFRFNDTDYDFSDWFYHNQTVTIINNFPLFINATVNDTAVLRTRSLFLSASAIDIEDDHANLTCIMQYRPPSGSWTDLPNEVYNSTRGLWTAVFAPNITNELGNYDFRVEFRDRDNATTGWNETAGAFSVENNPPLILNLMLSRNSLKRTEYVHIFIDGSDIENSEGLLAPELELRAPSAQSNDWVAVPITGYSQGRWVANYTVTAGAELGLYDLRARFGDFEIIPGFSSWQTLLDALNVLNNLPVTAGLSTDPSVLFRGETTKLVISGFDIENPDTGLIVSVEYMNSDVSWQSVGTPDYRASSGVWEIEYTPPYSGPAGYYDFRVRFQDLDGNQSSWLVLSKGLFVKNNHPMIENISFSATNIYRTDLLTIFAGGSDLEDPQSDFPAVEGQMRAPGTDTWVGLPFLMFNGKLHETSVAFDMQSPLGDYSFRARVYDSNGNESNWLEAIDAVELVNKLPQLLIAIATPIKGDITTVFNFTVTYFETEGELPISINLNLDGKLYTPFKIDPADDNPVDGIFYFIGLVLPVGEYSFFFSAIDESNGYAQSTLWSGLVVENITAPKKPTGVEGQVVDLITGNGIPGTSVFYSQNLGKFIEIAADSNGEFLIEGLSPGKYMLYASAPGYHLGKIVEVDVIEEQTASVSIRLTRQSSPDAVNYKVSISASKTVLAMMEDLKLGALVTDQDNELPADDIIFFYNWDFGDGSGIASGKTQSHNYSSPGMFNITLTVFDDKGLIDSRTVSVSVNNTIYEPPINGDPDNGDDVDLNGSDKEEDSRFGSYIAALGAILIVNIILVFVFLFMVLQRRKRIPTPGKDDGADGDELTEERVEPWPRAVFGRIFGGRKAVGGERDAVGGERDAVGGEKDAGSGEKDVESGEKGAGSGEDDVESGEDDEDYDEFEKELEDDIKKLKIEVEDEDDIRITIEERK